MSDKMINIGASFDSSGIKTGTAEAAKAIQDAGGKLSQVTDDIQTKTAPAFKNLQQAYRQTAKDAQVLAMTQGTSSAAFIEAAQRAADFKDQLDDVNDVVQAFHPEQRFKVAGDAISGMAGVMQGAVGAMQLFGVESENTQKTIATLMSLQGIAGMGQSLEQAKGAFNALAVVINTNVIPALASMQAWILANPFTVLIGAVVALGVAYVALSESQDRVRESNFQLELGLSKTHDSVVEMTNKLKESNKELQLQANAKLKGVSVDKEKINLARQEIVELEKKLAKEKEAAKFQDPSTQSGLLANMATKIKILQIQNEINANKDLIAEYEKKIKFENILAQKQSETQNKFVKPEAKQALTIEQPLSDNILGDLHTRLRAGQIAIENFVNQTGAKTKAWAEQTAGALQDFNKAILSTATNAFGQLGTIIGQSLAGADISIGQFFASIADQIGSAMIAIGSAMVGAALAGATAVAPMAYAYLGGGFALKSVAGYLGTKSGGNSTPKASGSYSGTGSVMGGNFSPNNMNVEINSRLLGNDLLLSVQKSNQKQTRVK